MAYLGQPARAIYAFLVAFLGSLATVMVGDVGFSDITDGQWVLAALVGLVAAGGVYGISAAQTVLARREAERKGARAR